MGHNGEGRTALRLGGYPLVLVLGLGLAGCGGAAPSVGTQSPAPGSGTAPASTPADPGSARPSGPTLGVRYEPNVLGFGAVRPTEIDAQGDGTSVITDVHWDTWGGPTAEGSGRATYVAPDQAFAEGHQETARVIADDLGSCGGHPAYRTVTWFFPQHGESAKTSYHRPTCTGP